MEYDNLRTEMDIDENDKDYEEIELIEILNRDLFENIDLSTAVDITPELIQQEMPDNTTATMILDDLIMIAQTNINKIINNIIKEVRLTVIIYKNFGLKRATINAVLSIIKNTTVMTIILLIATSWLTYNIRLETNILNKLSRYIVNAIKMIGDIDTQKVIILTTLIVMVKIIYNKFKNN